MVQNVERVKFKNGDEARRGIGNVFAANRQRQLNRKKGQLSMMMMVSGFMFVFMLVLMLLAVLVMMGMFGRNMFNNFI